MSHPAPMHFQAGSVARLLLGIEAKVEPVEGIWEGGKLSIRGPNVMAGYLKVDAPGVLQPASEGWHDTGDIVTIDALGFITIRGRAKRFAKIGGEVVSLPALEGYAASVWPDADHAVVTRADPRQGEQLVLFTTMKNARAADLKAWGKANGIAELALPRDIRPLEALPVLGTGKIDMFRSTRWLAKVERRSRFLATERRNFAPRYRSYDRAKFEPESSRYSELVRCTNPSSVGSDWTRHGFRSSRNPDDADQHQAEYRRDVEQVGRRQQIGLSRHLSRDGGDRLAVGQSELA